MTAAPCEKLWRTAVHEAGHAVVSHRLGFTPEVVTIRPSETTNGHMLDDSDYCFDPDTGLELTEEERRHRAAITCHAGLASESHFSLAPYEWPTDREHGALQDDAMARAHLGSRYSVDAEVEAAVDRCKGEALKVVGKYQQDIRKIAETLMEVTTLTDCEIEHLLREPGPAAASGAERLSRRRELRRLRNQP